VARKHLSWSPVFGEVAYPLERNAASSLSCRIVGTVLNISTMRSSSYCLGSERTGQGSEAADLLIIIEKNFLVGHILGCSAMMRLRRAFRPVAHNGDGAHILSLLRR